MYYEYTITGYSSGLAYSQFPPPFKYAMLFTADSCYGCLARQLIPCSNALFFSSPSLQNSRRWFRHGLFGKGQRRRQFLGDQVRPEAHVRQQ